jgi:hypothetical protein
MAQLSQSFHNSIDTARAYQTFTTGGWITRPPFITLRERSLTYRFFTHFHPYVPDLLQRLNENGFAALQESDTLYLPQPNPPSGQPMQPLSVIPNSTRATLLADVTGNRPNGGSSIALSAGTPLILPDGTGVIVKAGTSVGHPDGSFAKLGADVTFALPGLLPISSSSGIQTDNKTNAIIVPDSTAVTITLPAGGSVALTDGSQVQLPAGTAVAIRSGLPKPVFYLDNFAERYSPDGTDVQPPYPVNSLDFSIGGAYSIYNWELFFHAPLLIAIHLSQNQKFQDAQNWFHYIFKPTDNSPGPAPQRFWKVAPFEYTDVESIEQILGNLALRQDPQLYNDTIASITTWRKNPFEPWAVAKFRPTTYMLKTVMAYLDNLIAWGDSLFQQYTIETINEATQLYVMAANILGAKPQAVPKKGSVKPLTYNDLRKRPLDAFGNALVEMEVDIPFDITTPAGEGADLNGAQILPSIGQTLYFCIPRNDQLLGYWDTVADRLFKIHNSLNLQGVFQRLPLYDPPIDPALLVRAKAAGLDVSSIVSGLNQPLPLVRFQFLVAKAIEICQEVKSLGANLLSAIEKQDNEAISLLRAKHESTILGLTNMVKYAQWQEAIKATQSLQESLANAIQRYKYYQALLGSKDDAIQSSLPQDAQKSPPQLNDLDLSGLENQNFSQATDDAETGMQIVDQFNPNIATDSLSVSDGGVATLSNREVEELNKLELARDLQLAAHGLDLAGAAFHLIPGFHNQIQPLGCGATVSLGGQNFAWNTEALSSAIRGVAEEFSYEAGRAAKLGSYSRREQEWTFQSNLAKGEINQILKQLRGAQIREAIAQKDYDNHQVQMANAQQIVDFLQGNDIGPAFPTKETTIGFYAFMKRDVKALYVRAFQLAFDVAKKAERALQNELGDPSLNFVQFNYLDGNEGLLAGEKLSLDVKTMEMAYHDLNHREYELTKHVSLRQVDPLALVQLRATGGCTFTLPEELFDMDGPGHYFRRIKSLGLTLPCVAGPYTSVNCTLTLQKSSVRVKTDIGKTYSRIGPDDPRFNDYYGSLQSIVTSSAQADSGLFETSLHDERYLPFEAAGIAASQWKLTLPSGVRQFDFDTITDVVLHIRYTAREGGETLKAAAIQNLGNLIRKAQTFGSVCLFSMRHDFPSQWAKFQSATIDPATAPTAELQLKLTPELYPFWAQEIVAGAPLLKAISFLAERSAADNTSTAHIFAKADKTGNSATLTVNPSLGSLLTGSLPQPLLAAALTDATHPPLILYFDYNSMSDLWVAITWGA